MPIQPNSALLRAYNVVKSFGDAAAIKQRLTDGYEARPAFGNNPAIPAETGAEFRASLVAVSSEEIVARIEAAIEALQDPAPAAPTE